jgi:alkaline phosphatase D
MKKLALILICFLLFIGATGQKKLLSSGPMVGYSEMKEVLLWVQTTKAAAVKIAYWDIEEPGVIYWTNNVVTNENEAFTAHLLANEVEPGNNYGYDLYINTIRIDLPYKTEFQSLPIWKWRSDPYDFTLATGSCAYINEPRYDRPGEPYGGDYYIFENIHKKNPDLMIWLGDNVYLREADWNTRTGIMHRYTHDRAIPELQPLLGSVHHYAIWDDHDYGPNNSDKSYFMKETTLEAFKLFWANPTYGVGDIEGAFTFFQWSDADFFLLDNRYYRDANILNQESKTILGEEQLEWLKNALVSSYATFKIIAMGGQFLNTEARGETYTNYGFEQEREEIINFIHEQDIKGVLILSGDRHYAELSKLEVENEPVIYDLTVSTMTAGVYKDAAEVQNELNVEGTLVVERNFATLHFTGPADNRIVEIKIFNSNGELLWTRNITF